MSLTTLANVKAYRDITDAGQDTELARLITVVDAFVATYCRRTFELDAALVEYHSGATGQARLLLHRPPINSIASLYDDPERAYGAATLIASTDYVVLDANMGLVALDGVTFQDGLRNIKVTYSGGWAAIPADLGQAAIELVWLAREKGANNLVGLRAKSIADGNISILSMDFPAHLAPILDAYRLPDLGWD